MKEAEICSKKGAGGKLEDYGLAFKKGCSLLLQISTSKEFWNHPCSLFQTVFVECLQTSPGSSSVG